MTNGNTGDAADAAASLTRTAEQNRAGIKSGEGAQTEFNENVIPDVGGALEQLLEDRKVVQEELAELLKDEEITKKQARFEGLDEEAKAKVKQLELSPGTYRVGRHKIMIAHQEAASRSFDVKASTRVRFGEWAD